MKQQLTASLLGLSLIASITLIPSQNVRAVMFSAPPDNSAPKQATGGASRGGLFQRKSGESAPDRARGGASRSGIFTRTSTSGESAPRETRGGASRSGIFTRTSGESAPGQARGGASRSGIFSRTSGESAPGQARGGASRGDIFTRTSGSSSPGRTDSGASREGRRYLNNSNITMGEAPAILALLPQSYFGTTISQRPEILVYLPQTEAKESVFSLKDLEGNTLHQMTVPVSGKAGVISIKVPINLKIEKNYQWFLALKIDGQLTPRTPYIDGWIKRIQPNKEIVASMQQNDLLKQATAFGKHGIWYDCVATLAKLRAAQPNNSNLNKHWSELLESVGLEQIDKAPVLALNNISN